MPPSWTLSVRNFGPIAEADVTLAPLTVFIGRNNTGKSYLASLIWGLLNPEGLLFPREVPTDEAYLACDAVIKRAIEKGGASGGEVHLEDLSPFIAWARRCVVERAQSVAQKLFNAPEIIIGSANVVGLGVSLSSVDVVVSDDGVVSVVTISADGARYSIGGLRNTLNSTYRICSLIGNMLLAGTGFPDFPMERTLYVPAGRTGLVLLLPAVLVRLLDALSASQGGSRDLALPLPVVHFLQVLTEGKVGHDAPIYRDIGEFLEAHILGGQVTRDRPETPIFSFTPMGSDRAIPLHNASSLVAELGPVAQILKNAHFSSIILEEPEAHLHLEAQVAMARACARMVNAGINVIITTHSDTFLQQLNNLINVHRHPRRETLMQKWGLEESDLIDPAAARGYEFVEGEGGSHVQPMRLGRGGFVAETMNRTLRDMALLTRDVLADDEDGEE